MQFRSTSFVCSLTPANLLLTPSRGVALPAKLLSDCVQLGLLRSYRGLLTRFTRAIHNAQSGRAGPTDAFSGRGEAHGREFLSRQPSGVALEREYRRPASERWRTEPGDPGSPTSKVAAHGRLTYMAAITPRALVNVVLQAIEVSGYAGAYLSEQFATIPACLPLPCRTVSICPSGSTFGA